MNRLTVLLAACLTLPPAMAGQPMPSRTVRQTNTMHEMRFPFPPQAAPDTCAPAALSILLRAHGIRLSEPAVLEIMLETYPEAKDSEHDMPGFTVKHIHLTAQLLGLKTEARRDHFDKLSKVERPAIVRIAPFAQPHFAVWLGMSGQDHVLLADPEAGLSRLHISRFLRIWELKDRTETGVWIEIFQSHGRFDRHAILNQR